MLSVAAPGAATVPGVTAAVPTVAGSPALLSDTTPVKPFSAPTVTLEETELPATTVADPAPSETPKSGGGATTNVPDTACVSDPLAAVTVNGYVLGTADASACSVSETAPLPPVTSDLSSPADTAAGSPATLSVTSPVKPLTGLTLTDAV